MEDFSKINDIQIEQKKCIFCCSKQISIKYNLPIDINPTKSLACYRATTDIFDKYGKIVECKKCGLVFTNPQPKVAYLKSSYEDIVDYEYAEESASRSINAHLCLSTIKRYINSGKLLDIGCSTGFFLNSARIDFDVEGIELSKWAIDFAKRRFKLIIKHGDILSVKYPDKTFDVVTLIDVLEHLTNPIETISEIHRILKDKGLLYIVTPNINSFSSKLLRKRWWGLRPAHLFYFSSKTLNLVLKKGGFKILNNNSYGRIFTYKYWLSRIKNYNKSLYRSIKYIINKFNIENKFLYLNTRDSIEVVAMKCD